MAFPSKESKLISGPSFKTCARGSYCETRQGRSRAKIDTLAMRLASVLGLPGFCLAGVKTEMSTDVGSTFVRNSGTKDHLLEMRRTALSRSYAFVTGASAACFSVSFLHGVCDSSGYLLRASFGGRLSSKVGCIHGYGLAWIVCIL